MNNNPKLMTVTLTVPMAPAMHKALQREAFRRTEAGPSRVTMSDIVRELVAGELEKVEKVEKKGKRP